MKKWAILTILIAVLYVESIAQLANKSVSLSFRQTPLSQVLNHLTSAYQIHFSYVNDFVSLEQKVSIRVRNQPLQATLEELFRNTNITYQLVGSQIVLKKKEHSANKPVLTQTIRGVVLDKVLQTPLPGANIIVVNSEPFKGTATDLEGNFHLEKIPVGRQELKVSYTGYKDLIISNVLVNSGKEVVLTIVLEENVIQSAEVVVTAQRDKSLANNELIVNSVVSLRSEDINRFAGSRQDPLRMAGNYAGVISGDGQVNHIVVRGNSPRGLLWRLEGVDIINPNHFTFVANTGGGFGVINNNLLANSDFLTGAFPAEYGNKVSSVMDVQLRKGNNEKHEHTFQVGLNGFEYVSEGPVSLKNGSSYLASARIFDFTPLEKMGVDLGVEGGNPRFGDGAFKIYIPTKKSGIFSIWGMGGYNTLNDYQSRKDSTYWSNPGYATDDIAISGMYATGISHTWLFNEHTFGKLILSSSVGRYIEEVKDVAHKQTLRYYSNYRGIEGHHLGSYTITHKPNPRHLLKGGLTVRQMFYTQKGTFWDNDSTAVTFMDYKGNSYLWQSFLHWQFKAGERLDVNAGIYAQLFSYRKSTSLEPRFSVNYQLSSNQRVSLAYGLHSQIPPSQYTFMQFKDPQTGLYTLPNLNITEIKSHHLVAGYTHQFNGKLQFKTEAYYQHLYHVPISTQKGNEIFSILNTGGNNNLWLSDSLVSKGKGRNYGIEFTAERYFNRDFYMLATHSFFESKYTDINGVERHTGFSIGYITNLLAGKEFKLDEGRRKVLSVDIKASYQGGRRYIPINMDSTMKYKTLVLDLENAYAHRQKDQFRFDFRISYNVNLPKATHNIFIAADNVFRARNILEQYWDRQKERVVNTYQIGLFPYFGYRIHF